MSDHHWPWSVLGIAPTEDRRAIREAYAPLLKALDPDAATEAFMTLRDARDAALSGHFLHPPREEGVEEEDDFGLGDPLPEGAEAPAELETALAEKPQFTVEYSDEDDQRFQRMVELFLGEVVLSADELTELDANLDALLADDRMADLGHYARVEAWLAQLLADRYPRGAALFPRIAEHFQWAERAHELGIHPAIPWLFGAHDGYSRLREIETPGHDYHREWVELKRGKLTGPLWLRAVDKTRMANLITTIRRDYPWLEAEHWQPELVARWEKRVAGGGVGGPNPWVWMFLVAIFFAAVPRMFDDGTAAPVISSEDAFRAYGSIESPELALNNFMLREFPDAGSDGLSVESLGSNNFDLYMKMTALWETHKTEPSAFEDAMREEISRRHFEIIGSRSLAVQMEEIRHRQYILGQFGDESQYALCSRLLRDPGGFVDDPENENYLAGNYRYHMFKTVHDEASNAAMDGAASQIILPPAFLSQISNSSGVSQADLTAALEGSVGSDANFCNAMKAFYGALSDASPDDSRQLARALLIPRV